MSDVTIKKVSDLAYYQGPNAVAGIKFRTAARELGVRSWGMNVLELEPNCPSYPEHDHAKDRQEEVYVVLKGSAKLIADGQESLVGVGEMVRIGPDTKRKFIPGDDGVTLLALGATPGQAYAPRW